MSYRNISDSFSLKLETISEDQYLYMQNIQNEYTNGYKLINSIGQISATFYGGSKITSKSGEFKLAYELSQYLSSKKIAIITGGGPGIMNAGLMAAKKANNRAIGVGVSINQETPSEFATDFVLFDNFVVRKFFLRSSDLLFFFKGGVGTMDELFEVLTLIITKKLPEKQIFICNTEFFKPIIDLVFSACDDGVYLVDSSLKEKITYIDSLDDFIEKHRI